MKTQRRSQHTNCSAGENWLRVSLPPGSVTDQLEIIPRNGIRERIIGSSVYVSPDPEAGVDNPGTLIHTFTDGLDKTLDLTTKDVATVLIQAEGSQCLHVAELRAWGTPPDAPVISTDTGPVLFVDKDIGTGTVIAEMAALDYQGDPIMWSLQDSDGFDIDNAGRITLGEYINYKPGAQKPD